MKRVGFILSFAIVSFALTSCNGDAAKNKNAQVVANYNKAINSNAENTNGNSESNGVAQIEEVPTFSDASEALKKGDEYLEANNTRNAIDALKQSVELDPDFAEAHFKLGVAYSLSETENEPAAANASNSGAQPEKVKAKKKNSEIAFENSVKAYRKFVRENPKSHQGYYNLGRAYNKLFNDKEAKLALQKAVNLDGENSFYRTELGAVLIKLANYSSAIKELEKAIALDEDNFRAEDLLVKAKAGRRRTGFKSKSKEKN